MCAEISVASCNSMSLFATRAGEICAQQNSRQNELRDQPVLYTESTESHRNTSIMCSVVVSQGVAIVLGMGYVCVESFMRCFAGTHDELTREKKEGGWQ